MGNIAIHNGAVGDDAFPVQGSGHTISQNVAWGNARAGFGIHGSGHTVGDNVASGNVLGFDMLAFFSGQFTRNVASSNVLDGLNVNVSGVEIRRNAVIGNGGFGIRVSHSDIPITENNIFSNGLSGHNCGLENETQTVLMAPNNFWGAAGGPGPDPADAVCKPSPSMTIVEPMASKAFKIQVKGGG